jgi:putative MATE family efflux protein
MLGSAVQQVIALSDAILLYHKGETEFAAIGFVGVFYITIAAIGYSFSRAGQIMIARRMGEGRIDQVGRTFHTMLFCELGLAMVMWLIMQYASPWIFKWFLDRSPDIYQQALGYIHYRAFGIFFSYAGVSLVSLYTGLARTMFILVDTIVLAVVNLALNYALIFGKFGLPEMGIAGSGLASSIAEAVAFVLFATYILFDRKNRPLKIFSRPTFDWTMTSQQIRLSLAVMAQAALGQGSWVFFFGLIENLGTHALAISNLARTVYLLVSIPLWGFSTGTNTLVSNLVGQGRRHEVLRAVFKIGILCFGVSSCLALPILLFPETFLSHLLNKTDITLIQDTKPIFKLLLGILSMACFGNIMFNAIAGVGAMRFGLFVQLFCIVCYVSALYLLINTTQLGVIWAWTGEFVYWILIIALSLWYLRSKHWYDMKV